MMPAPSFITSSRTIQTKRRRTMKTAKKVMVRRKKKKSPKTRRTFQIFQKAFCRGRHFIYLKGTVNIISIDIKLKVYPILRRYSLNLHRIINRDDISGFMSRNYIISLGLPSFSLWVIGKVHADL